jgi:hypothetical protein
MHVLPGATTITQLRILVVTLGLTVQYTVVVLLTLHNCDRNCTKMREYVDALDSSLR